MNKLKEKVKWNWTSARINENAVAEEQEKREMKWRGNRRVKQVCLLKMLTKLLVHGLWGEKCNIILSDSDYCCVVIYVFSLHQTYTKFMFFVREMYPLSNYPTESTEISSHWSFCTCCGMKAWQMESVGCTCQSVVNFLVRVTSIATIPATLPPAWHHKVAKKKIQEMGGTGSRLDSSTGVMLVEKQYKEAWKEWVIGYKGEKFAFVVEEAQ